MISLLISFAVLIIGYLVYGKVTEKIFAPDDRRTPAVAINDGVDCVPMKTWKAFLIQLLNEALANGASNVVYEISTGVLGVFGGILAVAGVIVCPITSGDTAFRSARLILAETFKFNQKKIRNRLLITIPMLVVGGLLTWFAIVNDNGFHIIWRYFSWSNQTLAMIALWVATAYLLKKDKYRFGSLLTAFPASFMTAVSLTYILMSQEGFRLNQTISYIAGICAAVILFAVYQVALKRRRNRD